MFSSTYDMSFVWRRAVSQTWVLPFSRFYVLLSTGGLASPVELVSLNRRTCPVGRCSRLTLLCTDHPCRFSYRPKIVRNQCANISSTSLVQRLHQSPAYGAPMWWIETLTKVHGQQGVKYATNLWEWCWSEMQVSAARDSRLAMMCRGNGCVALAR